MKRLRFYGIETQDNKNKFNNKYYSNENGINSRLDEIHASILNIKLKKVDSFIKKRNFLAQIYLSELKKINLKLPYTNSYSTHVFHLFTVFHPKRDKIMIALKKKGINTRIVKSNQT